MNARDHDYAPDMERIIQAAKELNYDLCVWEGRDRSGRLPEPKKRQTANEAMAEVDRLLAELHAVRNQLVAEIRAFDDAFNGHPDRHWNQNQNQPIAGSEPETEAVTEPEPGSGN